ncbi:hypothetical protein GCM10023063_42510 [Arthrobacter methylotrophus]|uniref:Uncharacterized protein n=1 Tax=Arthrobacter methylotrophus TaxID=121291 RepID=A0ABV5UW12_9MICC
MKLQVPLDLVTVEDDALELAGEAYATADDRIWAHETARSYLTPLTTIVYSHFGLPKKVAA